jgi:hypothetical protein
VTDYENPRIWASFNDPTIKNSQRLEQLTVPVPVLVVVALRKAMFYMWQF